MADGRFFTTPHPHNLAEISAKCGAVLQDSTYASYEVIDVAPLSVAGPQHLSFIDNKKYRDQFHSTKAGAIIVHPDLVSYAPEGARLLVTQVPYKAYALAAQFFYPEPWGDGQISPVSRIHPTAVIGKNATISDYVVIGKNVVIGDDCWLEPFACIGDGVTLGNKCRVGPHTSLSHAVIGNNVRLYPGVRVGQDGFGFAIDPAGYVKVPQLGRVVIHDNVEIGANTTIDRGSSGDTQIGSGSWLDNMVQIGHNVKIGKGCVFAAQVGIAGSTEIGDYVVMGGQVGVAGHLKIGSMARIAAKSGITKDVPPREEWMGYPAMPMKRYLRQVVTMANLSENKKKEV